MKMTTSSKKVGLEPTGSRIPRRLIRPQLRGETGLTILLVVVATLYPLATGNIYSAQIVQVASLYLVAASGLNILRS